AAPPSIAMTWPKSVSTEARNPDHRVYNSTPAATTTIPVPKFKGVRIPKSAPPAMKFEVSEMVEPRTLEPASINCEERPWRAYMTSASVGACGATLRMRFPQGEIKRLIAAPQNAWV